MLKSISIFLVWFVFKMGVTGDDLQYGSFDILITKTAVCQGPKSRNCVRTQIGIGHGGKSLEVFLDVIEDIKPEVGKIMVFTNGQQKSSTPLYRMKMDKPCEHVFMRPVLDRLLNLTASCIVRKGQYKFSVDIIGLTEDYFGGKFMFGNFSFKSFFGSKKCNFSCVRVDVAIFPKQ